MNVPALLFSLLLTLGPSVPSYEARVNPTLVPVGYVEFHSSEKPSEPLYAPKGFLVDAWRNENYKLCRETGPKELPDGTLVRRKIFCDIRPERIEDKVPYWEFYYLSGSELYAVGVRVNNKALVIKRRNGPSDPKFVWVSGYGPKEERTAVNSERN